MRKGSCVCAEGDLLDAVVIKAEKWIDTTQTQIIVGGQTCVIEDSEDILSRN